MTTMGNLPKVVSREEWLAARKQLLAAEKELTKASTFLRVGDEVFHTFSTFGRGIERFHYGIPYLDLTALGRQEEWEEPKGRAVPLGMHVSGPALRFPDEYET